MTGSVWLKIRVHGGRWGEMRLRLSRDLAVKAAHFLSGAGLAPVSAGQTSSQHVDVPDFPVLLMMCWLLPNT